jgi:hypothetical protein
MQTITKQKVKSVLNSVIKAQGKATNKEIMDILRKLDFFATQGMVVGFTNQVFNEEPHNYEKNYNEEAAVLVYSAKTRRFECYDKNNERNRGIINSPTSNQARSEFSKVSGSRYADVRASRVV